MLNFPDTPSLGQVHLGYHWDGEKWLNTPPVGYPPSDTNPLMNGVLLPGLSYSYARADHVHPSDTSRVLPNNSSLTGTTAAPTVNIAGNIAITGTFYSLAKGHYLGTASGAHYTPTPADANIVLYDFGAGNWCGMGTDVNGAFWVRTGLGGSPGPALFINQAREATLLKVAYAPTPAVGDNSTKAATTAYVLANPASGPYVPLSGGTMTGMLTVANSDMRTHRGNRTGVVYLSNSGSRYIYYDGSGYYLNGAHAYSANGRLWGNGDYAAPITNIRLAYVGDYTHNSSLAEPWGGCCVTGHSGYAGVAVYRYRQFQVLISGGWRAVGYA
jgi:hypothetical protein